MGRVGSVLLLRISISPISLRSAGVQKDPIPILRQLGELWVYN